jgi:hypothetical protein
VMEGSKWTTRPNTDVILVSVSVLVFTQIVTQQSTSPPVE